MNYEKLQFEREIIDVEGGANIFGVFRVKNPILG
jgi:hypothetical protein